MAKSPILGGFSTSRSPDASDNEAYNLAVEVVETKDGKVPGFLFLQSGLDLVGNLGSGPIRGVLPLNDLLYVVSGPQVWSLTPNGIATLCGTIGNQASPVSMFENNRQLMIVDGVDGWLVPGGFPLTGGTIAPATSSSNPGGGLYAPNDTITLKSATGSQSSYPIVKVTSVSNFPATSFIVSYPGTTYNSASNVATTAIQPQPGGGSGFTINITGASGGITSSTVDAVGSDYAVNDTGFIAVDAGNALYRITAIGGGGTVAGYILINPGSSYSVQTGAPTAPGGPPANLGTGLTVFTVASAGPISAAGVNFGGVNYALGDNGLITGGSGDAVYLVTSVGEFGTVTGFTFVQGGAVNDVTDSFSQLTTSGSGSGFELIDPEFGAFIGLVPVTLPFSNPIMGGVSDGFGVLVFLGQQILAASLELDLSTWPALSFGIADQSPDTTIGLAVIHDEVYINKVNNTEVWIDQGLANFPFGPITSVHIEFGSAAPFSVAKADEDLIWLSRNDQGQGMVVMASGYKPEPISTQALVSRLQDYPNLGDAIAYVRQEGQHVFYVLTFPEADESWVYDKTSSKLVGYPIWTRLAAFDNGQFHRHWGNAFTPWKGSVTRTVTPVSFQAESVEITTTILQTPSGLNGLPTSFSTAVFSVWVNLSGSLAAGLQFSTGTTSGIMIEIQNAHVGSPEITIEAWDADNNFIVAAEYSFGTWAAWVNVLVSVDVTTETLQVFANTVVSAELVETLLTPNIITWASTNPIAAPATQPWSVIAID